MHGLGNDFVVIDARNDTFVPTLEQAKRLSDRRRGVGCDQIIVLETSDKAEVRMRIFNADGGQAEACGNATRCVASLLYEETGQAPRIETVAGILHTEKIGEQFQVDMGLVRVIDKARLVKGAPVPAVILEIGNPHCVFVTNHLDLVSALGPKVEVDPQFPNRTNVQFVQILNFQEIRQRVWERGAGLTAASGSGACAGAVAAIVTGHCQRKVTVAYGWRGYPYLLANRG